MAYAAGFNNNKKKKKKALEYLEIERFLLQDVYIFLFNEAFLNIIID